MKTTCGTFISFSNKITANCSMNNSLQVQKKASQNESSFIQSQSQMSGKTSGSARSTKKKRARDFNKKEEQRQWKELRNKRLYGNFKSVSTEQIKRFE